MKNFITRVITGIVYVVLLVGCTLFDPVTSFIFFALVAAATVWEFCTIMNNHYDANVNRPIAAIATMVLCGAVWLVQVNLSSTKMLCLYGFTLLYLLITELYRNDTDAIKNWALAFASQIYIALPFALVPTLSVSYDPVTGGLNYDGFIPLSIFIFLWASDSGAYLVGSLLGKYVPYKLFPRISPNKSWIGSIGGGLIAFVAAAVIAHFVPSFPLVKWMGLALVVTVFGTWGDLVESLIKRQLGIKDSGKVLPGHGGLLDRFDSALLAIPAAVIYIAML